MRLSQGFTKTKRDAPKDEVAKNAQLLIRAGFIHKEMAGVYTYLPLGLKVINNIVEIIREEMNQLGGQELLLATLQDKAVWQATDKWDDKKVDIWFKTLLKNKTEVGLGWSHEAPLTNLLKQYITSHKDLPQYVYQFQTKLRNETRAKSGILRTREFLMKDLYSFSKDTKEHDQFYAKAKESYLNIFKRLGLGDMTYVTIASGAPFTKEYSHEFQTLCEAGEDTIYLDRKKRLAINKEVYSAESIKKLGLKKSDLEEVSASEVGNIFPLEDAFPKALELKFTDKAGKQRYPVMGCYGIGPGRVMGVLAEVFSDDRGLIWPSAVAPAKVHLISMGAEAMIAEEADLQYKKLQEHGIEVLYDDRADVSAGAKLADADLMGIPVRLVVSSQTLAKNSLEVKKRNESKHSLIKPDQLSKYIEQNF